MNDQTDKSSETIETYSSISNNYEHACPDIANKNLQDYLHRGDISSGNRVLLYVDVILATCATFLIIPLKHLKAVSDCESLLDFFQESSVLLVSFVAGSLLIYTIWESINIRHIIIKHLDDMLIMLTILSMLFITLLPFTFLLIGHYPEEDIAVYLLCVTLLFLEIIEILMTVYSFSSPWLLHSALHDTSKKDLSYLRNAMCLKNMVNILFLVLAILFITLDYRIPWIFVTMLLLLPHVRKAIFFTYNNIYGNPDRTDCVILNRFVKGNIGKKRIESFADVAIAVIACLLMLDITTEEFSVKTTNEYHNLTHRLKHIAPKIYIFLGMYIMVSLLWYINHTVLNLFQTINIVIFYLQKFFLVFVCWLPFTANILHHYIEKNTYDTKIAVRFASIVTFLSGFCNLLMLFWAIFFDEKIFHKWASYTCLDNLRQHFYILLKLLNIPLWSGVLFIATFGPVKYVGISLAVCFGVLVSTFILLKVVFAKRPDTTIFSRVVEETPKDGRSEFSLESDDIISNPSNSCIEETCSSTDNTEVGIDTTASDTITKISITESDDGGDDDGVKSEDDRDKYKTCDGCCEEATKEKEANVMEGVVKYFNGVESEIFHEISGV